MRERGYIFTTPPSLQIHRYYQFKYESRSQRGRQLGVIGEELTGLLPEAVEVVASRVFPNPEKGQPPITVTDLAVVDKNILFMYNIGAIQALAAQQDELEGQLEDLMKLGDEQYAKMESNLASIRAGLELRVSEEVSPSCFCGWRKDVNTLGMDDV